MNSEPKQAIQIANRILDVPNADPDRDEAIVARQFVRLVSALENILPNVTQAQPAFSKGYKHRHGEPVSDACGDGRHSECTQDVTKCHCTCRGGHTTPHAYMNYPAVPPAAPAQPTGKTIEAIRNYRPERELPSAGDSRKAAVPPAAETAMTAEQSEELDAMVRDFCKVGPRPKSEVRSRIKAYAAHVREAAQGEIQQLKRDTVDIDMELSSEKDKRYTAERKLAEAEKALHATVTMLKVFTSGAVAGQEFLIQVASLRAESKEG